MIGVEYVVAIAMAGVNLFKKQIPAPAVPLVTVAVTVGLNMVNAVVYGGDVTMASQTGLIAGGIAAGLFASADAVRKSESTPFKSSR